MEAISLQDLQPSHFCLAPAGAVDAEQHRSGLPLPRHYSDSADPDKGAEVLHWTYG